MKRSSRWTIAFATAACLTTASWAQHGGGAGVHDGGQFAAHGSQKGPGAGPGAAANFEGRLAGNSNLSQRLQSLLPPGTSLEAAAQGFKNQGQFIAALHVSHNLNIPFSQLKGEMVGPDHDSLGRAIRDLRPDLGSKTVKKDVKQAENQAKNDVEETETPETSGN